MDTNLQIITCLGKIMSGSIHGKVEQHWGELKKYFAFKESVYFLYCNYISG